MTTPKKLIIPNTIIEVSEAFKPRSHHGSILVWEGREYISSTAQHRIKTGIKLEILSNPIKSLPPFSGMDVRARILNGELAGLDCWAYLYMIRYGTTPV